MPLAVVMFATAVFCYTGTECLWSHVQGGMDLAAAGHVLSKSPYAYTSDITWINHEWLFEMFVGQLYQKAGSLGLTTFKLAVGVVFSIILILSLLRSKLALIVACTISLLVVAAVQPWMAAPRPQIFDLVFMSLVLIAVSEAQSDNRRMLYFMPLMFLAWANLHGAFVAGLGVLGFWCGMDRLATAIQTRSWRVFCDVTSGKYAAVVIGSILATLLNPYGIQLHASVLHTVIAGFPEIENWQPISIRTSYGKNYAISILCAAVLIFYTPRKRSVATVATFILLALLPLSTMRHVFAVYLAATILFARDLAAIVDARFYDALHMVKTPWQLKTAVATGMLLVSAWMISRAAPLLSAIPVPREWPVKAVSLLKNSHVEGNMVVFFDWGDYCEWHLYPSIKVSIDARRETTFSYRVIASNFKFTKGILDWDELLRAFPTSMVLTSRFEPAFNLMEREPGWQLCYSDEVCGLFARTGSPTASAILNSKPVPEPDYSFP